MRGAVSCDGGDTVIAKAGITVLWFGWLMVFCSASAVAQSQTTGRIAGTVKDHRGALIVGAEVTVSSKTTAEERKVKTDDRGNYAVPLLPPGMYRISVTANGFKKTETGSVRVFITETSTVEVSLEVGTISEQVVGSGSGPLIRLGRSESGCYLTRVQGNRNSILHRSFHCELDSDTAGTAYYLQTCSKRQQIPTCP